MTSRAHPRRTARRGAVTVETAVIIMFVLLIFFGIFEYGRFLMVFNLTEYAAREGARAAAVSITANRTQADLDAETQLVKDAPRAAMGGTASQLEGFNVEVVRLNPATGADAGAWYAARYAEPVAVRITGTYRPMISLILPTTVPLRLQATAGSEAN